MAFNGIYIYIYMRLYVFIIVELWLLVDVTRFNSRYIYPKSYLSCFSRWTSHDSPGESTTFFTGAKLRRVAGWVAGGCWDDDITRALGIMDHVRNSLRSLSTSKFFTIKKKASDRPDKQRYPGHDGSWPGMIYYGSTRQGRPSNHEIQSKSPYSLWLVVDLPLWKTWKSDWIIIPAIGENKKCSKPPTSILLRLSISPKKWFPKLTVPK